MRPRLPNRRAVGAAQRCAAAFGLDSARGARGQSGALQCKANPHLEADIMASPKTGQKDKPRSAGPRCGDPTRKLSALWRQYPREIQAMHRLQPNRRAEGAARRCAAAFGLCSAQGAQGPSDALRCKANPLLEADIQPFPKDRAERQAAQRGAGGRRSDPGAMSLYGGQVRTKFRLRAHGCQIAGPWVRPSDERRPSALTPREGRKRVRKRAIMQRRSARRS